MILPIFLTTQFVSVKLDEKASRDKRLPSLINLRPTLDPLSPVISTARIRELLKGLLNEDELTDVNPIVLSIAENNYDIDLNYNFEEIIQDIPFPLIVPEYYYSKAVDMLMPSASNIFLNCRKYGFEIPEEIKIQLDSIAIGLYTKDHVGKFISQNQIIISTTDVDPKFKKEYTEAMVKALADSIQIAGVWKISIDTDYSLFPKLIESLEKQTPIEEFFENLEEDSDGKLIIAPGVGELQIGENDNFETLPLTNDQLNKFKIKEDDKITFKWKSDKSKFEGEIYGSKTGIKIDTRERV